jgi:hypothetical protein
MRCGLEDLDGAKEWLSSILPLFLEQSGGSSSFQICYAMVEKVRSSGESSYLSRICYFSYDNWGSSN